jgi:hypothetical protein
LKKKSLIKKIQHFIIQMVPNIIEVISVKVAKVLWGIIITHLIYWPYLGRHGYCV